MSIPGDRTKEFLERRTSIAILATVGAGGTPETCLLVAPHLTEDGNVAGGEEDLVSGEVFRNLRKNPRATILVLDPIMDPRARDGVRLEVEFLGAQRDGDGLKKLSDWLSTFAPGRRVVRRLLFKIHASQPYRPRDETSALLSEE